MNGAERRLGKRGGLLQIKDMAQKPYHISGSLTSFPGCAPAAHWKLETSQLGSGGFGSRQKAQIPIDFVMYLQSCVYSLTANSTASGTKKRQREEKWEEGLGSKMSSFKASNRKYDYVTMKGHI